MIYSSDRLAALLRTVYRTHLPLRVSRRLTDERRNVCTRYALLLTADCDRVGNIFVYERGQLLCPQM